MFGTQVFFLSTLKVEVFTNFTILRKLMHTKVSKLMKAQSWRFDLTRKLTFTAQKMKFFIKDFLSKCNQIHSFLRIWSHLRKKSLMENFIFCAVCAFYFEILQISQKNACVEVSFLKQLQVVRKALLMRNTTLKVPWPPKSSCERRI